MNEVQLIRRELAAQRRHGREIGASWSAGTDEFNVLNSDTYNLYFSLIIDLESKRIASHLDRLRSRSDLSDAAQRLLESCAREFATLSTTRVTACAPDSPAAVATNTVSCNVQSLNRHSTVAQQLEAIAESRYGVDDWRRTSHLDADSILEELRLRKQALGEARGPANG
jgi:hypothetical protein